MLDPGLRDIVVLITGANSPYGIGAATAAAFAAQGAAVFITYLRQPPADNSQEQTGVPAAMGEAFYRTAQQTNADLVFERIRAQGGRIDGVEADLADPQVIPQLFDQAEAAFGPVAVLINNAAYCAGPRQSPHDGC